MKFIGQNIYDLVSKFRNDVYLTNNSSLYSGEDGLGDLTIVARDVFIKNDEVDSSGDTTSGDPTFRIGSSDTECLEIVGNYQTSAKNLQIAVFKTLTDSGTANDGRFRFKPDNVNVLEIDDGGIDFYSGFAGGISFNGTDILTDNGSGTTTLANIDALDATTISTISSAISAGDITAVTITTDSGGGSKAEDTGGSADFSILGANGVGVTNSGATITAVAIPGEIDHDSLNNFVAAEHVDWASASAGTIHSTNIPTLNQDTTGQAGTVATIAGLAPNTATTAAAQTNITSLGTLTGLTVGGDLTVNGDTITFESTAANDPTVTIQNTTDDTNSPRLRFFKRREDGGTLQVGEDGDGVGEILFNSYDDNSGTPSGTNYAKIEGFIHDATNGQESGQLKLQVAAHDGGVEDGIVLTGGSVDTEVDVTIGNGAASVTTIAGSLRPKGQLFIKQGSFAIDPGTARIYFPMTGTAENTSAVGVAQPFLAPANGKLLKIHLRANKDHSAFNQTFHLVNWDDNEQFTGGALSDVGAKTVTGVDNNNVITVDFQTSLDSGTNEFTAGELIAISVTNASDISGTTKYIFTAVFEFDFSSY